MSAPGSTDVITNVNRMVKAGSHANVMQALNYRPMAIHVEVSKNLEFFGTPEYGVSRVAQTDCLVKNVGSGS